MLQKKKKEEERDDTEMKQGRSERRVIGRKGESGKEEQNEKLG